MNTTAIIICAGEATRWGNYLGTPKHLINLTGEPILARTARLLHERGVSTIYVITKAYDPSYDVQYAIQIPVTLNYDENADADKFLSSKHLWNQEGRTIVCYGDVYFTDEAMDTIVGYENQDWRLFCRPHASEITGTLYGECFAQSFYPEQIVEHENKLNKIARDYKNGLLKRCGGWEHYRAMCGVRRGFPRDRMIVIDDWTEDFDTPEDYEQWTTNWRKQEKNV